MKQNNKFLNFVINPPKNGDENGIYIVKPKDNSYRAIWAVVWDVPLKLMSTSDGYTKEEVDKIISTIKDYQKENDKLLENIKLEISKLNSKKADRTELANVVAGLVPMGSVANLAELETKPKRNNDAYYVEDQLSPEGNAYIYRWDAGLNLWVNTKQVVFKDVITQGVYDVSSHNDGAFFESISTLLGSANLSTLIPASVRRGGMSIRFIQSSDNKYVQYRLTAQAFSTTENDWQGVDGEITAVSDNLAKSSAVYNELYSLESEGEDITDGFSVVSEMIMRKTTEQFESSSSEAYKVYYKAITKGKSYNVKTLPNQVVYLPSENFTSVAFSKNIPTNGGAVTNIVTFDTEGNKTLNENYTALENGYLCIFYSNNNAFDERVQVIEKGYESNFAILEEKINEAKTSASNRVSYTETQSLTNEQKDKARTNINAASQDDLDITNNSISSINANMEDIYRDIYENKDYSEITTGRELFAGTPHKSTMKYESTSSDTVRTLYIPVVAGKYYKIQTSKNIWCPSTWIALSFCKNIPSVDVSVESIKDYTAEDIAINETFISLVNGYIGVAFNGDVQTMSSRIKFYEADANSAIDIIKEDVNVLKDAVDVINDNITITEEEESRVTLTSYVSGIILRNTTSKLEATTSDTYNIIYIPILKGEKYEINGNTYIAAGSWSLLGFGTTIPAAGGSFTDILHYDSGGTKVYTQIYTATKNGYLYIFFGNNISNLNERMQVYKYIQNTKYVVPLLVKGMISESSAAKDILTDAPQSFNIGLTNLRAKQKELADLTITNTGSNYNDVIEQYLNTQDCRRTSKLIKIGEHNLDPHIGDFTTLSSTYWREVIGIDSEGWIYCAQRKYANVSNTGGNVNIYRTKDFDSFEIFKENSCGHQLVELENGELCLATYEVETVSGTDYIRCYIYVTSNHKMVFNKKFACTQISQYTPAAPWSWGIQTRGSIVAVGEYGQHGNCGKVWYSRDFGEHFYEVFDLRDKAPDVPHAHVHGICVDPYFDRLYIINGDNAPASSPELLSENARIWWWDYNGETLSDNLKDTIVWKYISVGKDTSLGVGMQFVQGYALKDCVVLTSDSGNNGIFRINRTKKEDTITVDFAHSLGIETSYTKFCGGNMFRRDDNSPLFICVIREASYDLEPDDPNNPSHRPNTYKNVLSRIYTTYDGFHFEEVWIDNTYGEYTVHYSDGTSEQRNIAKCGRDMSVYQLPNGRVLLKYNGRDFQYVEYNNNGTTGQKDAYVPFANEVEEFIIK